MLDNSEPTKCPQCGSTSWSCWDESLEWFKTKIEEDYVEEDYDVTKNGWLYFEFPVGGLTCKDCKTSWKHAHIFDDAVYVGDNREFNIEFYGYDPYND